MLLTKCFTCRSRTDSKYWGSCSSSKWVQFQGAIIHSSCTTPVCTKLNCSLIPSSCWTYEFEILHVLRPVFKIASMVLSSKWWWSAKIATPVSMAYGSKYELNKRNFIYSIGFFSVFLYEENTELIINASKNKGMTLKGTPWSIKSSPLLSLAVLHMTQFLPDRLHMKFTWFKVFFSFCCFP